MATSIPTLTPADLGLVLQIASTIDTAFADQGYRNSEETVISTVESLEALIPELKDEPLSQWLEASRMEWFHQSPSENFGLFRSQWQAVRILEKLT